MKPSALTILSIMLFFVFLLNSALAENLTNPSRHKTSSDLFEAAARDLKQESDCPESLARGCREWVNLKKAISNSTRADMAVAFLIDKSGSMEALLPSAAQACTVAIRSLRESDFISIVGFDTSPYLIVGMDRVSTVKQKVEQRLKILTPSGTSELFPALLLAERELTKSRAPVKHLIVVSDFMLPLPADFFSAIIKRLKMEKISISTFGFAKDSNIPLMKLLAGQSGGSFNIIADRDKLPKAVLDDLSWLAQRR